MIKARTTRIKIKLANLADIDKLLINLDETTAMRPVVKSKNLLSKVELTSKPEIKAMQPDEFARTREREKVQRRGRRKVDAIK
jgi:hypothetical protein